jgi:hypothetical protein
MKVDRKRFKKLFVVAGAAMALVAGMVSTVPSAYAGGTIKADDDKWISVGTGVRTEFSAVQHSSANGGGMGNNFAINNARIYINGKIHKYVGFEFNTECYNCATGSGGGGSTNFGGNSTIGLLDAIGKFEFNQYANLWVGRMLVTGERGELNGPFYHATFEGFKTPLNSADYSSNFGPGTSAGGVNGAGLYGRDNGVTFWGQVDPAVGHLQYSVGVYSGLRNTGGGIGGGPNQQNNMLYAGRLTYNFFNAEKNPGYYTSGTYYGTAGNILAIAVGANHQMNGAGSFAAPADLTIFVADLLFEKPIENNGGVITVNAEVKQYFANYNQNVAYTGRTTAVGDCFCMFDGLSWTGYAMYLLPNEVGIGKFQPYARFTAVQPNNSTKREETEAGMNYIIAGHNARISAFWQYGDLASKGSQGGASIYAPDRLGDRAHAFKLALQFQY